MTLPLDRCRQLRIQSTVAEVLLWCRLRDRRLAGIKFRRQHPVGPYVVDFFCPGRGLVVELDGGQHFQPDALAYDRRRSLFLMDRSLSVLRFTNDEVLFEMEAVLDVILAKATAEGPSP